MGIVETVGRGNRADTDPATLTWRDKNKEHPKGGEEEIFLIDSRKAFQKDLVNEKGKKEREAETRGFNENRSGESGDYKGKQGGEFVRTMKALGQSNKPIVTLS